MTVAQLIAETILEGFDNHYQRFREISAQAQQRFERAAWSEAAEASHTRIDMYDLRVKEAVARLKERVPDAATAEGLWLDVKRAYIALLYDHRRPECAETFYNSVACRVLHRTYYRNEFIFWRPAVSTEFIEGDDHAYRCFYPSVQGLRGTLLEILNSFGLRVPFEDLRRDLHMVIGAVREVNLGPRHRHPNFQVQVLSSLFFRNQAAYLVGRIVNGNQDQPFVVPIRHVPGGGALYLDAVLLKREHIGTLFSLDRSYFMVDMDVPSACIGFLREIVPSKPVAELYTAVGLQKQGKTDFYRQLFWHLKHSQDHFTVAPGTRGMVMMVFTLPSFPYVFKVIRDTFAPPKNTTRAEVRSKYQMVKYHDRVGRMADTLEYSDVALPVARIAPELLTELRDSCASSLDPDGDRWVIRHLYVERRMTPLDLWLREADAAGQRAALDELGRAIKDLARTNIFPGDLLLKNFGITRWGRVVFYDYDDLDLLTDIHFRALPQATTDEEEMAGEPWFSVGPKDVFPEELSLFLLPSGTLRDTFLELHPDLADPAWWIARQQEIRAGAQPDLLPYPIEVRFPPHASPGRRALVAPT